MGCVKDQEEDSAIVNTIRLVWAVSSRSQFQPMKLAVLQQLLPAWNGEGVLFLNMDLLTPHSQVPGH